MTAEGTDVGGTWAAMETPSGNEIGRFYYFSFGSNLNQQRLMMNCKTAKLVSTAFLDGYELQFTLWSDRWGGAAADITVTQGGVVEGALWSISLDDHERLRKQEGVYCSKYREVELSVRKPGGERVDCVSFKVVHAKPGLMPSKLYMGVIIEGALAIGLSSQYIEFLRSFETTDFNDDTDYRRALQSEPNCAGF